MYEWFGLKHRGRLSPEQLTSNQMVTSIVCDWPACLRDIRLKVWMHKSHGRQLRSLAISPSRLRCLGKLKVKAHTRWYVILQEIKASLIGMCNIRNFFP